MSQIPYIFETPVPSDFRKNGWFKCDNTLKFVTWAFSRCSTRPREIEHDGRKITLQPYQFIFGRLKCSTETNMSEDEVRTQQKHMEDAGFLKKIPNQTPSRFTLYEWVTTAFSQCTQVNPQVNPQVNSHPQYNKNKENENKSPSKSPSKPPSHPHNLEEEKKEEEASHAATALEIEEFLKQVSKKKIPVTESCLRKLIKKYGLRLVGQQMIPFSKEKHIGDKDKSAIFTALCNEAHQITKEKQKCK